MNVGFSFYLLSKFLISSFQWSGSQNYLEVVWQTEVTPLAIGEVMIAPKRPDYVPDSFIWVPVIWTLGGRQHRPVLKLEKIGGKKLSVWTVRDELPEKVEDGWVRCWPHLPIISSGLLKSLAFGDSGFGVWMILELHTAYLQRK